MPLHRIIQMYVKVRISSWLSNDEQHVYLALTSLERIVLATFYNGKLIRATASAPDDASGLGTPGSPDGPPPEQS